MSRTPMPSPNGTNRAGLYLTPGTRAAVAYDAAPDDDEGENDFSALLIFLEGKLDDADLVKVKRMLGVDDDADSEGASDAARRRSYAADAREQHRLGRIDSREMERRIVNGPPRRQTEADRARFKAMFPDADRLKVL